METESQEPPGDVLKMAPSYRTIYKLRLGIFDKNCIFVQNMPCNIDFVVYTIL